MVEPRETRTNALVRLTLNDSGQDLIEYALLAGLVSLVALGAVSVLGQQIRTSLWDPMAAASF